MHSHLLILAILSLRALAGMTLTAYDQNDVTCSGKPIGNTIEVPKSDCVVYQPEQQNASILFQWRTHHREDYYEVYIYSDTNCQDYIASLGPKDLYHPTCENMLTVMNLPGGWGGVKRGAKVADW
ncbi:hypothetical protein BDR22DRAFT_702007 [Usnea florida]